jgi:hypothetical protein
VALGAGVWKTGDGMYVKNDFVSVAGGLAGVIECRLVLVENRLRQGGEMADAVDSKSTAP